MLFVSGFLNELVPAVRRANPAAARSPTSPSFRRPSTKPKEWQAAMEALILVAELGGPTMFARIGVMRALNCHVERVFNPDRNEHHLERRKLKRDG